MRILYIDCFFGFDASMLLGALIDAGASADSICHGLRESMEDFCLDVKSTLRCSIECKKADASGTGCKTELCREIMEKHEPGAGTNTASMEAVLTALELLNIEYVMCSDIGVPDGTDGESLSILEEAGIEVLPAEDKAPFLTPADAAFLRALIGECGPKPRMDITAIGYGAGGEDKDSPHLITAVIGEFNPEGLFEAESREKLIAML